MRTPKKEPNNSVQAKNSVDLYGRVILTLKNCLLPEDKLSPTPSQVDGLDQETEIDLRILGCELIQTAGILLKLPQVAMATAQVLFQRFYYSKSFVRQNFEITGMGCLYLASKIEEAPRRIRDVINVYHHIKQLNNQKTIAPMLLDQNYIALKYQVIKAERRVLKELGFCVHVKHPHKLIVMYLQVLGYEKNQTLMQLAWNFMNDSLRTDVFVRYQPETVACACIYLTARRIKLCLPKSPPWFVIFKVEEKDIQDVCLRILRLYSRPKPKAEVLEKKVQELCKKFEENRQKNKPGYNSITSGNNTPNSPHIGDKKSSPKRRSHSDRSHSRSASASPRHKKSRKYRRSRSRSKSRSRSRSRSYDKKYKKSQKNSRRSRSSSPSSKRYKDKSRYRSRSRSYDRDYHKSDKYHSLDKSKEHRKDDDKYRKEDDKYRKDNNKDKEEDKYRKEEKHRKNEENHKKNDKCYSKDDEEYKEKYKTTDDKYAREVKYLTDKNSKYDDKYGSKEKHKSSKYKDDDSADDYSSRKERRNSVDKYEEKRKRRKGVSEDDEEEDEDDDIMVISVKKDKRNR